MSQIVPVLGTVRTGILEGLASGTSRDVPSSPSFSWDYGHDRDSRVANLWDLLGCLISPRACWDHRTVRGYPRHVCLGPYDDGLDSKHH